jgi:hypothetical protein
VLGPEGPPGFAWTAVRDRGVQDAVRRDLLKALDDLAPE